MKYIDIGFTGNQLGMTLEQKLRFSLGMLPYILDRTKADAFIFHHGVCIGSDYDAHQLAYETDKCSCIVLHPPTNTSKMAPLLRFTNVCSQRNTYANTSIFTSSNGGMVMNDQQILDKLGRYLYENYTDSFTWYDEDEDKPRYEEVVGSITSIDEERRSDGFCETCYYEYMALVVEFESPEDHSRRVELEDVSYIDALKALLSEA